MWRERVAGVGLASLLAGTALAQPPPPAGDPPIAGEPSEPSAPIVDPSTPPPTAAMPDHGFAPPSDEPPPPPPYPRAYTQRPLILPSGAVEGNLALRIDTQKVGDSRYTIGSVTPAARVGFGPGEMELGTSIYMFRSLPDGVSGEDVAAPDRLQTLYADGRFTIAPETVLTAQFILQTPQTESTRTYVPGAFIEHKEHLSTVSSLHLIGGVNYSLPSNDDAGVGTSLDFLVSVRAAAQLSSLVAIEGRADYDFVKPTDDASTLDYYTSHRVAFAIVGSLAPDVDLIVAAELASSQFGDTSFDGKAFTIGVSGRRIP